MSHHTITLRYCPKVVNHVSYIRHGWMWTTLIMSHISGHGSYIHGSECSLLLGNFVTWCPIDDKAGVRVEIWDMMPFTPVNTWDMIIFTTLTQEWILSCLIFQLGHLPCHQWDIMLRYCQKVYMRHDHIHYIGCSHLYHVVLDSYYLSLATWWYSLHWAQ